jgi:hypothetical protein
MWTEANCSSVTEVPLHWANGGGLNPDHLYIVQDVSSLWLICLSDMKNLQTKQDMELIIREIFKWQNYATLSTCILQQHMAPPSWCHA